MASAKTKDFEIYLGVTADAAASNATLDLTDYVDIADNEAFEVHAVDIVLDPAVGLPANDTVAVFQLADANIQAFISHSDRASLYVARQTFNATTLGMYHQESFSDLTPLIVSKTLWLRNELTVGGANPQNFTIRILGRIVKPSAKDYMALVLTQTGNVA
jgi:hypothetical protein